MQSNMNCSIDCSNDLDLIVGFTDNLLTADNPNSSAFDAVVTLIFSFQSNRMWISAQFSEFLKYIDRSKAELI